MFLMQHPNLFQPELQEKPWKTRGETDTRNFLLPFLPWAKVWQRNVFQKHSNSAFQDINILEVFVEHTQLIQR